MLNMREENIKTMKLCLVKERYIEEILNNLVCPEDDVFDFELISWRFDKMVLYKEVYHESINSMVKIYLVDGYDIACGGQFYNITGKQYTHVEYSIFISKDVKEDENIFEFILGHELAHFDLSGLPKYEDEYRTPTKETYCDIKSLENLSDKIEITEEIKSKLIECIEPKFKKRGKEFYTRSSNIDKYLKGEIDSNVIYNNIINS